jgi:hypothetical protein
MALFDFCSVCWQCHVALMSFQDSMPLCSVLQQLDVYQQKPKGTMVEQWLASVNKAHVDVPNRDHVIRCLRSAHSLAELRQQQQVANCSLPALGAPNSCIHQKLLHLEAC